MQFLKLCVLIIPSQHAMENINARSPIIHNEQASEKLLTIKEAAKQLGIPWVAKGKHLFYVLRSFEFSADLDEELLKQIFEKAAEAKDETALNQIVATVSTKFLDERKSLISDYFIPTIRLLTQQGDCHWIFNFWYRKERILREQYDNIYGMFIYRGAKLLKNIFPQFNADLEKALVQIAYKNTKDDLLFVMAILRNYEGQPFIHGVCKELVKILPEDDELLSEVRVSLQSTGIVHGTHGFAEAFERKISEIKYWLQDGDTKIRSFAEKYINGLKLQIEAENKRADENIILRKHQYGADTDQ